MRGYYWVFHRGNRNECRCFFLPGVLFIEGSGERQFTFTDKRKLGNINDLLKCKNAEISVSGTHQIDIDFELVRKFIDYKYNKDEFFMLETAEEIFNYSRQQDAVLRSLE